MTSLKWIGQLAGALAAMLLSGIAIAQTQQRKPDLTAADLPQSQLKIKPAAANPCAQFGPGFARVAGSDTCVKVGGGISVGGAVSR